MTILYYLCPVIVQHDDKRHISRLPHDFTCNNRYLLWWKEEEEKEKGEEGREGGRERERGREKGREKGGKEGGGDKKFELSE